MFFSCFGSPRKFDPRGIRSSELLRATREEAQSADRSNIFQFLSCPKGQLGVAEGARVRP